MEREEFKNWLINDYKEGKGMDSGAADNRVSNTKKVENAFGDLDTHFKDDKLASILDSLKYSKEDAENQTPLPTGIVIEGDYYTGMASLRQGVNRYLNFKLATDK